MQMATRLLKQNPIQSALLITLLTLATASAQADESYQIRVVARGLNRPTGIVAEGSRTLYISQLPTPGVAGPNGGRNSVDKIALGSGRLTNLTMGEPEPTNLALDKRGSLYWTCKSAGVILERSRRGVVAPLLTGLTEPSGIAVDRWERVYFTLLPTPGVPGSMGGNNTVNVSDGSGVTVLAMGEPEPTDIAVTRRGEAYWTCKSAGVILKRATDGTISLVLEDLHAPTGIALDHRGEKLYFTEVPTPGVAGNAGGMNKVSVYDLDEAELWVVNMGDPEPTDIAVARNGRVYWTCSSAGVIVEARRLCDYNEDED